jgi:hypothetical protein
MVFRVLAITILLTSLCYGVIIADPTGASHTSPPPDDPGFYNVGTIVGQGSGIYLGNFGGEYWVLTANHVGGGTFFNHQTSTSHTMVSGSYVQLLNPDSSPTDLGMFRISTDPGLPTLAISSTTASTGSAYVMTGAGRQQEAGQTTWDASWVEGGAPTAYTGYKYQSPASYPLAYGTNNLDGTLYVNIGGLMVHSIYMDYDSPSGSPDYEGVGATGDSGGAIFYKNGGSWELAGVMLAVATFVGQPANTAVFGNTTFAADLSFYRSQILATVPEPRSWLMFCIGVVFAVCTLRRRRALATAKIRDHSRR